MRFLSVFNDSLQNSLSLCAVLFLSQSLHFQLVLWNTLGVSFPQTLVGRRDSQAYTLSFVEFSVSFSAQILMQGGSNKPATVRSVRSAYKGLTGS